MATAYFKDDGGRMQYTPSSAVAAGDVVVVGDTVGVATQAIAANTLGSLSTRGLFLLPKASGSTTAIAAGKKVYWSAGSSVITETSSGNKCIGYTHAASVDADTTQLVELARA
jgi:predicted RecA/RadA family phage recombinase